MDTNNTNNTGRNNNGEAKLAYEKNPFERNFKMPRSSSGIPKRSVSEYEHQMPPNVNMEVDLVTEGSNYHKLGEQIRKMVGMLEDGKIRAIHQPIKDAVGSMRALYKFTEIE